MGLSRPVLLPLKTHWHFCKCHRFTSFSKGRFSWWCSWVIRQRPPCAPPHSTGGRVGGKGNIGIDWNKEQERRVKGFKKWSHSWENIIESLYNKHARPSRVKPLSWQWGGRDFRSGHSYCWPFYSLVFLSVKLSNTPEAPFCIPFTQPAFWPQAMLFPQGDWLKVLL